MRVLIGTDTYRPDVNGSSYFTQHLAAGLASRGHDVHVLCPSTGARGGVARSADGVVHHRAPSLGTPFHPTFRICPPPMTLAATRSALRHAQPDVVHLQGHFPLSRELCRQARRRGLPVVATNHFMPENLYGYAPLPHFAREAIGRAAWWDFVRVFERADLVTAPTLTACRLIGDVGLGVPVTPVSCGVDRRRFHPVNVGGRVPGWRGIPDRPTVLFVGRLDEEKRVEDLIGALAFARQRVDAQLVLVGIGCRAQELAALAARRGVAEDVIFAGFVPDAELPTAYAACDVFANAGVAELQSLVTMEAMASGKPVVAADAMALPHLVHHGRNGFRFRPGDTRTAASHMAALLEDQALRERMGGQSLELIADHGADASLEQYEALYLKAVRLRAGNHRVSPRLEGRVRVRGPAGCPHVSSRASS